MNPKDDPKVAAMIEWIREERDADRPSNWLALINYNTIRCAWELQQAEGLKIRLTTAEMEKTETIKSVDVLLALGKKFRLKN